MSNKTQPARGMRDFLPADVRKRNYVINIIKEVYESYGFEPLETPAVENLETLTGKYGEEGNQLMFRILKRGEKLESLNSELSPAVRQALEKSVQMNIYTKSFITATIEAFKAGEISKEHLKAINELTGFFVEAINAYRQVELADLALRYDLTVPLARVVANYKNDLPKFFKRYQIQPVWRADRPARGRFREFYQCDVDAIGSSSMIVEAELISAVSEILQRLGFDNFVIKLNHRELLREMLNVADIAEEKHADALTAIDKLDKIQREGVFRELLERGITDNSANKILDLFDRINLRWSQPGGSNRSILSELFDFTSGKTDALDDLSNILQFSNNPHIKIDPSLARGLSYYTGAIFEINVPDLAGSLGGGGRYDGLIGMFGKEQIPACGFSLGLERILVVMDERGMLPPELQTGAADVLVTVWSETAAGESLKLANELRANGGRVLVYPEADKLGKQFKYADSVGIKAAIIMRDEEIAENKVKVKNLRTSEEVELARNAIEDITELIYKIRKADESQ